MNEKISASEKKIKVAFHTLGCRLNIFETDGLASNLEKLGAVTVTEKDAPDVFIINTCTVTNKADSRNRNVIRSAIKKYPGAKIWVTGCYAETDRQVIENIPGVTGVAGNSEKSALPYMILNDVGLTFDKPEGLNRFSYSDVLPKNHTRAYLKIQDGCSRVCSYCKIPQARGKGESRDWNDVLNQVRFLQDQGIAEIVLTGVNLGWFKDSEGKKSFNRLLSEILDILDYSRLRISSIEPSDVNTELAELISHPRFCKFLHVPLQSGSSSVLRKMKRSYTAETFRKRIESVKKIHPDIFIGTDVIAGFPTESENDFSDTKKMIQDLEIARVHAFPYSPRKGTGAEEFGDVHSKEIKKSRVAELINLSSENLLKYGSKFIGKKLESVLENDGSFLTDNFLKIKLKEYSAHLKTGQFADICITQVSRDKEILFFGTL
ncbi:MAG TPA: tRNA (N(6)-L-threonylcarbamoyladenosine(37)-C(2))-methylthiotransferase MtaB [Leptospiraceae bacterium]|nr:tRNA (N(6)-L-threonylcarbamoyladenosine(37)-C(2))-methylthiotransferase MtaB [Leptospiraceae bacterium]